MAETKQFQCHTCGHIFSRTYGVVANGHAVLYCNRCGQPHQADFSVGWTLPPDCACGGSFDADALGCCPQCGQQLSAKEDSVPHSK